jgi:hypothetical protein
MTMSTSVQTTAFSGPRTTIMSNIASPKPYDTGAHSTPDLENIRLSAMWHTAN